MNYRLIAIKLSEANDFVHRLHRHHRPVQGHKFSLGAFRDQRLVGVAIVGRPVARNLDDGTTLEITRLASDGTRNVCSFLLGACARAANALGYRRIQTYTLCSETGASLRGAGWRNEGAIRGHSWNSPSRERVDKHPTVDKMRWCKEFFGKEEIPAHYEIPGEQKSPEPFDMFNQ